MSFLIQHPGDEIIYSIDELLELNQISHFYAIDEIWLPSTPSKIKKQFRFIKLNGEGNEYSTLDVENLNLQKNIFIENNLNKILKIDILITVEEDLNQPYELKEIKLKFFKIDNLDRGAWIVAYPREKNNRYFPLTGEDFTLKIYQQPEIIKLYKTLSYNVNNIFGIDVIYFKADAEVESRDPFLLEYGILHHRDGVKFKVLVNNNEFPDNKLNFTPFGIEYELPLEVHIDKKFFENIFGNATAPQRGDIIYFKTTDRIYEVENSQIVRSFLNEPVFYKLLLRKFSKKSGDIYSPRVEEQISQLTQGLSSLLEMEQKFESARVENNQQTSFVDIIRYSELLDLNLLIENYKFIKNNSLIFENFYNFEKILHHDEKLLNTTAITYDALLFQENIIYTAFFNLRELKNFENLIINSIKENQRIFIIQTQKKFKISKNDFVKIFNDEIEILARVVDVDNFSFRCELLNNEHINSLNYFKIIKIYKYNLLFNFSEFNKGISFDFIENKIFLLKINNNEKFYKFTQNEILKNKWYAVVIKLLPTFKQFRLNIYETDEFNKIISFEDNNFQIENFENQNKFEIKLTPIYLTNIRVLIEDIRVEDEVKFLKQLYITDPQNAKIIDNAFPLSKLKKFKEIR